MLYAAIDIHKHAFQAAVPLSPPPELRYASSSRSPRSSPERVVELGCRALDAVLGDVLCRALRELPRVDCGCPRDERQCNREPPLVPCNEVETFDSDAGQIGLRLQCERL
jgi:hypothetical protein